MGKVVSTSSGDAKASADRKFQDMVAAIKAKSKGKGKQQPTLPGQARVHRLIEYSYIGL